MLKIYNRETGEYELVASNNASNIIVDDPAIVSGETPLSTVLSKTNAAVQELRGNVKWLYKYGGTGSGGGTGGGGTVAANSRIEVTNTDLVTSETDKVIYVSENSLIVKYRIFNPSNNIKFTHSVYFNDALLKNSESINSNVVYQISLQNLNPNIVNTIRITALDDSGFNLTDYTLKVISGSISINSSTVSNNGTLTKYYGTGDFTVNFNIFNRIKGATTVLEIKMNNLDDGKVLKTFNIDGEILYTLNVMKDLNSDQMLEVGTAYSITAQATTTLGVTSISSGIYKFTVSLIDSSSLIVTLANISEPSTPDDDPGLKTYLQGSDISFNYTVNAASYSLFRVAFEIEDSDGNILDTVGSVSPPGVNLDPFDNHDLWTDNKVVSKGVSNNFSYSTNKLESTAIGVMYVNIYAWSSDGAMGPGVGSTPNTPTKIAKFKIEASDRSIPNYTSANKRLYVDINAPLNFSEYQDRSSYTFTNRVIENTEEIDNSVKLDLYSINNVTSGFVKNYLTDNYATMRVSGGSYAKLLINYFKGTLPSSWSMNDAGFTVSLTFKSDVHPDANGSIFSYAIYDEDGDIVIGIEVSLEEAKMVYTDSSGVRTISATLIQGVKTTVDFVCEKDNANGNGLMKLYLDGVLTAVDIINDITTLSVGTLNDYALFGCKEVGGMLTNFCDVNIYNIRIYKSSLSVPDIIKNYIINYAYLNKDFEDNFDWPKIESLMNKNFINRNWECIIWDTLSNTWKDGSELYSQISSAPALPVVLLSENNTSDEFRQRYSTSYNEINAAAAQEYKAPITMEMTNVDGTKKRVLDMQMSLQGTSSMSYASKNLEIYFGQDQGGKPRLFTPKEDWLPENQFTLKADVIDSAHANNTAIGTFINNSNFFDKNYAMMFNGNPYADKVKHTLEGFPVYLFVKFGDRQSPTFLGIYNFNLGRGSSYNMGFKVLSSYTLDGNTGLTQTYPALVTNYTEVVNPYNNGVFSFEINTNSPVDLTGFQQPDKTIVDKIIDQRYPSKGTTGEEAGWERLYKMFDTFSKMYKGSAPQIWKYENNNYVPTSNYITGYISPTMEYFPTLYTNSEGFVNWKNANAYFVLAMAFGMVDSLGKNLTLRTWNASLDNQTRETRGQFYTSFYDMDTALGLDNYGAQDIDPAVYIDYWYNEIVSGYTVAKRIENGYPSGVNGYDMPSSRLWEVVRDMIKYDPGNVIYNYQTLWSQLRQIGGLLSNVEHFMETYYYNHTKDVGEIVYNLDYNIKYLRSYSMQMPDGSSVVGYNDVKFLHGNRKNYVNSWLNKRFKYIDGCMNITGFYALDGENNKWVKEFNQDDFDDSPYVEYWSGRGNGSNVPVFEFDVTSNIPTIFCMVISQDSQRVLLRDNEVTTFKFKGTSSSNSTMSWNNVRNISRFQGFSQLNFKSIGNFNMSGLLELDLSNMSSFDNTESSNFNISSLVELRSLKLENTKALNPQSGFIVDTRGCFKLKNINIKNSDVGSLLLPGNQSGSIGAGVLDQLQVSGSLLQTLNAQNQQFLKTIDFTGCKKLQTVNINSFQNLETLTFAGNTLLQQVVVSNCPKLKSIVCQGNTNLSIFNVDTCESIETVDLSNCTNNQLEININGAYNLQTLNLYGTLTTKRPILPSYSSEISNTFYDTMTTLNLNNSRIVGFDFGSVNNGGTFTYKGATEPIMDLSHFKNLTTLIVQRNTGVKYIKFNNDSTLPYLVGNSFFDGCTNLRRVFGHISFNGTYLFNDCNSFYIHEPEYSGGKTVSSDGSWRGIDTSISGMTSWNSNSDLHTNISFSTTSLANDFVNTNISMYDVYYILNKADNITNLSNTFRSCLNLYTTTSDPVRRDIFSHCGNVTTVSGLFIYCYNMRGQLFSVTRDVNGNVTSYNGVLSPLVSVTGGGLSSMFYGCRIEYIDDYLFWQLNANGDKLKVTSLDAMFYNYSPKFVQDTNAGTMVEVGARASKLLIHLPRLTSLSYMFRGQKINFDSITLTGETSNAVYCPLFFYNTGMTSIENSFYDISAKGTWENLFGGQDLLMSTYPNNFPKSMSSIRNSFVVSSVLDGSSLSYPLRNDMFTRIKSSIRVIGGTSANLTTESSSFSGYINKTYDPGINNNDLFPYSIFKGCTQLTEIPAFFNKLNYTTNEVIELPGYNTLKTNSVLFQDCMKLENLSYAFSKMNGVKFKLTSKGFVGCNLRNVSYIFEGNTTNLEGKIPYGLFYMETPRTKTVQGWLASELIFTETYGVDESGKFITGTTTPTPNNITVSYRDIKKTIDNVSYALSGIQSQELKPYTIELGGLTSISDSGDVLRYNDKYNTVKYILNANFNANTTPYEIDNPNYNPGDPESPAKILNPEYDPRLIVVNPEYSPYYRVWNEWAVDGGNLDVIISASTLYQNELSLPRELPSNFYDVTNTYMPPASLSGTKFYTMNYVLPPDVFRYCNNNASTNVNYFMAYTNREGNAGDEVYGLSGKIPPKIFEPLSEISNLIGIFSRFKYICPYSWNHYDGENEVLGTVYPPELLKPIGNKLKDVSYLFSQTTIHDKCVIPSELFYDNLNLQFVSWLFSSCSWLDSVNQQLPSNLFYRNLNIMGVNGMFGNGSSLSPGSWTRGPKIMSSSLFTPSHKNINDISYFMNWASVTTGSIPEFWLWTSLPYNKIVGAFNGLRFNSIDNLDDAIASKYSAAVTNTIYL